MSSQATSFCHLLSPGRIGKLEVRNRIAMAPMGSNFAEPDGRVSERTLRYYEARARGGVGLIICGVGAIAHPEAACIPRQLAISDDRYLDGLARLAAGVHAHGARIAIQLQHASKTATQDIRAGRPLAVPSPPTFKDPDLFRDASPEEMAQALSYMAEPGAALCFHEMTRTDIERVVEQFADAADRARRAGFDGVEIHAAHGYLISAFLSPASNHRSDEYGGTLENRARLLVEVVRAVRERVGDDFAVWCRLDGCEFRIEDGITLEDAAGAARLAADAGADAIHVSAYADPTSAVAFTDAPLVHEPARYLPMAAAIRRRAGVPVIAVGRLEPEVAEEAIADGKADFVAMARKLLADPELANKLAGDERSRIRPCIYSYACVERIFLNDSIRCAVNPRTGREYEPEPSPVRTPRRVLVAGGGPAGMEAARIAALRGHDVVLCDRGEVLGGRLALASVAAAPNAELLDWLRSEIERLLIDVRLGCNVDGELVTELSPDVVVVAGGARPADSAVQGLGDRQVWTLDDLDADSFSGAASLGPTAAIVGGGLIGLCLADWLSADGIEVTVVEASATLGLAMALPRRWRVLHDLRERGVVLAKSAHVVQADDDTITYQAEGGEPRRVAAATVIVTALTADTTLAGELSKVCGEIHSIGDCREPAFIAGAIADATRIATTI